MGERAGLRKTGAPYRIWGGDLESEAVQQLRNACELPVAVAGALMPDAHVGYGLPIGGVLATTNAIIPYAVGVDIACRMKLNVLDLPVSALTDEAPRLTRALERETRFGVGAVFQSRREHEVMDADWRVTPLTSTLKDRAWSQLGTSGSGNHFVEFGELTVVNRRQACPRAAISPSSATRAAVAPALRSPSTTAGWRGSFTPSCPTSWPTWRGWISPRNPARNTGRPWN
jgi:tRNA-splicing ligase RtcB